MSQENVDTLRAMVERWNAGVRDADAIAAYCDPAIVLESPFSSVVGEPYRGHAGIAEWTRDVDEQFSEWRLGIDDTRESANAVLTSGSVHGCGRASGVIVDFSAATIAHFGADGRVTRVRIYLDLSEALADFGQLE